MSQAAEMARHCCRGHALVPENLYHKAAGGRQCRQCALIRAAAQRARRGGRPPSWRMVREAYVERDEARRAANEYYFELRQLLSDYEWEKHGAADAEEYGWLKKSEKR